MKKNKRNILLIAIAAAAILAGFMVIKQMGKKAMSDNQIPVNTAIVKKGNIVTELKASGTLAAKNTYKITSMVEGEILAASFSEGDQVEKGQILYEINKSAMDSELSGSENSLTRANSSLEQARKLYEDAVHKYSGNTYKAKSSGYIKELFIKAGSKVDNGTKIADLYNDQVVKLKVPFLSGDAAAFAAGAAAVITLSDTGEQIQGTVETVSSQETALTGGRLVRRVTISVQNPGGLTNGIKAAASIGGAAGAEDGTFEPETNSALESDVPVSVEVEALLVNEGDYVQKGTPLFRITEKSADDLKKNYTDPMNQAEENAESAKNKLDSTRKNYENYTIKAPISGTVVAKKYKAGDTISKNTNTEPDLAVIYDLSDLTFKLPVDELDIHKVKTGQKVAVTADACPGKTYPATVTNVSLESAVTNGVSTYPVIVTLDKKEDLIPGINVQGVISLGSAEDVLLIPVAALMRGNLVYIKDDKVLERQGDVPAGFRAVKVETGLISAEAVEIKNGLTEGEEVYVAQTETELPMGDLMEDMGGESGEAGE
nr:HlyD family efflux transporter periplasmic adaptor subunit [uncultured Clostridium sp.]